MIRFFLDAFKITNNNIILATPLILFMLLTTIYNSILSSGSANFLVVLLGLFTSLFMWAAFLSGWFFIIRQAILYHFENISREEKAKKSFGLMSLMVKGIGKYFLPFIWFLLLEIIFFIIFVILVHYIGVSFIGKLNIPTNEFFASVNTNSPEVIEGFINSLPREEIVKLAKWIYLCMLTFPVFLFLQMFWASSIVKDTTNIFKALWRSLKFLFCNFASTFIFFIMIGVLHFCIMLLCGILSVNSILSYFSLLIYFYFMVYIAVLVFLFYEKYEKKGCSGSGSDSIGQDSLCCTTGKED